MTNNSINSVSIAEQKNNPSEAISEKVFSTNNDGLISLSSIDENSLFPLRVVCTKLKQPYKLFYNLVHQGKYKCLRFSPNGVFYTTIAKMKSFIAEQEKYQFENKDNLEK